VKLMEWAFFDGVKAATSESFARRAIAIEMERLSFIFTPCYLLSCCRVEVATAYLSKEKMCLH